jgi:hypothetical protein
MGQQVGDLLPAALGGSPLELEGLGNRLTGHGQLHGQPPGMYRGLSPEHPRLRGPRLPIVSVGQESSHNGGDERGMQERLHGTRPLGVDLVEAVDGLVQLDAEFHLPSDPIKVGHLPGAEAGREIRQEEAVPLRRVDADEAEMQRVLGVPHADVGINGPAIKDEEALLDEGVKVSAGEEFFGDVTAGDTVHLGLPIIFEADDEAHMVLVTGPQPGQAGIGKVRQQATALPGLVDLQMAAVMLPRGAEVVAHWCPAADGENFMDLDGCVLPAPRELLTQGAAHGDRGGIDDIPILDLTQDAPRINLLRAGIGQGALGQGGHELFKGFIEPAIEGRAGDPWSRTFKIRPQDIRLVGSPGGAAAMTIARTKVPRSSLRCRSITPNRMHKPSMASCGRIASKTCRTSSPVMAAPLIMPCPFIVHQRVVGGE